MLRELGEEGIGYVPVDPEYSTGKWEIRDDGKLLGPLTNIHGIGPKKVDIILKAREDGTPLTDGLAKLLKDPKTPIDSLFPIRDRIRQLYPQGYSNLIVTPPTAIRDIAMGDQDYRVVIGVAARLIPKDENEPVKVARRGGLVLPPPTQALILFLKDDTDEILMKVDRLRYEKIGRQIQSAGKPGRIIFAIKGTVPRTIRMVNIEAVRMLGYMTDEDEENGRRAAEVVQETPA
jgi:hypothetical protein